MDLWIDVWGEFVCKPSANFVGGLCKKQDSVGGSGILYGRKGYKQINQAAL